MSVGATFPQFSRYPQRLSDRVLMLFRGAWAQGTADTARVESSACGSDIPTQRLVGRRPDCDGEDCGTKQNPLPVALEIRSLAKRFERPAVDERIWT